MTQTLYIVGSILLLYFLFYAFINSKKAEFKHIIVFKMDTWRMVLSAAGGMALGFTISTALTQWNALSAMNRLALGFWSTFLVFHMYTNARKRFISEEGYGFLDVRRRVGKDFVSWSRVRKYDIANDRLLLSVEYRGKLVDQKFKIHGSEAEVKDFMRMYFKRRQK